MPTTSKAPADQIDTRLVRKLADILTETGLSEIEETGDVAPPGRAGGRPAALYRFGDRRIQVTDQGPGIPDDLLARLFVPFDRLGADAGREGGAGLGLVLAKRLTEAMGGTLDLDSTVGVGTRATITLEQSRSATDVETDRP